MYEIDIGKILGKLPRTTKIPLQGSGLAAIPKMLIFGARMALFLTYLSLSKHSEHELIWE